MILRKMLSKQAELDSIILKRAELKEYPIQKVKLALLVELGELANETACFKYWKQNHVVVEEKVKEEWADTCHFALSLENHKKSIKNYEFLERVINNLEISYEEHIVVLMKIFKSVHVDTDYKSTEFNEKNYEDIPLVGVLLLGKSLGMNLEEMEQVYFKKWMKNIKRQQENY